MVRKIWKHQLSLRDKIQSIEMPSGAKIVHVAPQGEYVGSAMMPPYAWHVYELVTT